MGRKWNGLQPSRGPQSGEEQLRNPCRLKGPGTERKWKWLHNLSLLKVPEVGKNARRPISLNLASENIPLRGVKQPATVCLHLRSVIMTFSMDLGGMAVGAPAGYAGWAAISYDCSPSHH